MLPDGENPCWSEQSPDRTPISCNLCMDHLCWIEHLILVNHMEAVMMKVKMMTSLNQREREPRFVELISFDFLVMDTL